MNHLTLVPQGGLCNRLRAVLSAVSLVEEQRLDADIRVGWCANDECASRFDQLFEPFDSPRVAIGERAWYDRPITRRNLHWPALVRMCRYAAQHSNTPPSPELLHHYFEAGRRSVYVSTGFAFCDYSPAYVRRLRPLPHLQQQIDTLCRGFDEHTIGIHIRRTDHVTAISESPVDLFEQAIDEAIAHDPDASFYLATDDNSLKQSLRRRHPRRIMAQDCHGTRSDLRGMEEAVVDLWTLARTSRIVGSFWSSYTDTAAEIGGIPLEIIRK